jgi:hypothetical protein
MPGSVRRAVLSQVDWWWRALFRRRLDGLTDEELWWEPAPGCWTLHADESGVFRYEWPPGSLGETEPPFTTIAWRLCHMGCSGMAQWAMAMEGDPAAQPRSYDLAFPAAAGRGRRVPGRLVGSGGGPRSGRSARTTCGARWRTPGWAWTPRGCGWAGTTRS